MQLTANQIQEIKDRYSKGEKKHQLAKAYGVENKVIYHVIKGIYGTLYEKKYRKPAKPKVDKKPIKSYFLNGDLLPEMNRLYDEGKTIKEISDIYRIHAGSFESRLFYYRQKARLKGKSYNDILAEKGLERKQFEWGFEAVVEKKDQLAFIKSKIR